MVIKCKMLTPPEGGPISSVNNILAGNPDRVKGLLKIENKDYALVKWTSGDAYLPYESLKKHFPELLIEFYDSSVRFKRIETKK